MIARFAWYENPFDRNLYPESGMKKLRDLGIQRLATACIVRPSGLSLAPKSAPSLEVRLTCGMW
jgi:hypothetical protein